MGCKHWCLSASLMLTSTIAATGCSDSDDSGTGQSSDYMATAGNGAAAGAGGSAKPPPSSSADGTEPEAALPDDLTLPIVFVHGFAGSAQQFDSQAMRFVVNGFPAERLHAFEHDGAGTMVDRFATDLDAYIDEVRSRLKAEQVYLIGHSRGTAVSSLYLSQADRAKKVAKYIALDGAGCANVSIPCIAPAQTTNTRAGQTHPIPGQKHVEVATSKESFAIQFEFLFDREPRVLDIVKQRGPVEISGRAVNFPANTGRDGAHLAVWKARSDTGLRSADEPLAEFDLGSDGAWGPVRVDPDAHYEFVLTSDDSANAHHFYMQHFPRSSAFVRLLSGPPDSDARAHSHISAQHTNLTVSRMREWTPDDVLEVATVSKSAEQPARNVISQGTGANRIAIYLQDDAASPEESTLDLLPWFPEQPFQTGVDLYMPAGQDGPDGTITLTNQPRGDAQATQVLHVPNWPSDQHTVSVLFSDYPQ